MCFPQQPTPSNDFAGYHGSSQTFGKHDSQGVLSATNSILGSTAHPTAKESKSTAAFNNNDYSSQQERGITPSSPQLPTPCSTNLSSVHQSNPFYSYWDSRYPAGSNASSTTPLASHDVILAQTPRGDQDELHNWLQAAESNLTEHAYLPIQLQTPHDDQDGLHNWSQAENSDLTEDTYLPILSQALRDDQDRLQNWLQAAESSPTEDAVMSDPTEDACSLSTRLRDMEEYIDDCLKDA